MELPSTIEDCWRLVRSTGTHWLPPRPTQTATRPESSKWYGVANGGAGSCQSSEQWQRSKAKPEGLTSLDADQGSRSRDDSELKQCATELSHGRFVSEQNEFLQEKCPSMHSVRLMGKEHAAHPGHEVDGAGCAYAGCLVLSTGFLELWLLLRLVSQLRSVGSCS